MGGPAAPAATGTPRVVGDNNLFSRANSRPVLFCAIGVIGAVLYGYDGTYQSGIFGMQRFQRDFGSPQPDGRFDISSAERSLLASIVQAGEVVGALAAAPLGDASGRRGVFFGASLHVALGAVISLLTTSRVAVLTAGRFVLGLGIGMISNSTPLYLSEIAPTPIRGIIVSCWQLFLALGQVLGACVAQGTKDIDSPASYRIPIALNIAIVAIIVAGIAFVPESPRWLITKDRDADARAALVRINATQHSPQVVVEAEYATLLQSRADERELAKTQNGGWAELARNPVERRKFLTVLGILASQQISGVQMIFSYTTTFFRSVGVRNEFLVTIVVNLIEVIGVLLSFALVSRYGRRSILLLTSFPMLASLLIMGGLGTVVNRSETENRLIAAMICIYVFFFNLGWGPLAWVCASELAGSGRNRGKIMGAGTALFWVVAFIVTFTMPYLFDADKAGLGAQIGWIYAGGMVLALFFVFFFLPETRGRSLESINEMLDAHVPSRRWATYRTAIEREAAARKAGSEVTGVEGEELRDRAGLESAEGGGSSSGTGGESASVLADEAAKGGKKGGAKGDEPKGDSVQLATDTA